MDTVGVVRVRTAKAATERCLPPPRGARGRRDFAGVVTRDTPPPEDRRPRLETTSHRGQSLPALWLSHAVGGSGMLARVVRFDVDDLDDDDEYDLIIEFG